MLGMPDNYQVLVKDKGKKGKKNKKKTTKQKLRELRDNFHCLVEDLFDVLEEMESKKNKK